jgi:hypothetical protein
VNVFERERDIVQDDAAVEAFGELAQEKIHAEDQVSKRWSLSRRRVQREMGSVKMR